MSENYLLLDSELVTIDKIEYDKELSEVEELCLWNEILIRIPFLQRFFKKKTRMVYLPNLTVSRGSNE